jgi:hypothetical protein
LPHRSQKYLTATWPPFQESKNRNSYSSLYAKCGKTAAEVNVKK